MGEHRVERRIGAIELSEGRAMKLFKARSELAQLRGRLFVGGLVIERGAADEFGGRNSTGLGVLALDSCLVLCRNRNHQSLRRQAHFRLRAMIMYMIMSKIAIGGSKFIARKFAPMHSRKLKPRVLGRLISQRLILQ